MNLSEALMGGTYRVQDVTSADAITRRLEALGLVPDTHITVTNRKRTGTVIIKVRGTWLALGEKIARGIQVLEVGA